ncbi:hypothetical protein Ccar_07395 [Clostridium carboxidivorans P7]|uniref:Uncharacterized protein n=1 Tax=Clostridium carboxidivorans P7 TaxID=536227 RepID=C6PTR6_9CLOT|nr:hypothetical protein [Clostridium carboxidivorans]AKN30663.1 hypothetical protein Ccar_07395 [Clostridium carboxidivorans P7]EET87402.1 conserved hypothetical protein [Clostridium carboxidivorans P7]EFG86422.1 hypothetical protein CLCAR_4248 [Clostridium carboxidivorans P7]
MNSIGIRVTPVKVYYSIVNSDDKEFQVLVCSNLTVPKVLNMPERLGFIRNCLFSIILEYKVKNAGIRILEEAVNYDVEAIYIEGVIQELIYNSSIEKYFIGVKSKIALILKKDVQEITYCINNKKIFENISQWSIYCKEERESIIAAVAASRI